MLAAIPGKIKLSFHPQGSSEMPQGRAHTRLATAHAFRWAGCLLEAVDNEPDAWCLFFSM